MIRRMMITLPLFAALGGQGGVRPTAVLIIRTPGAAHADSAAIAAAVTRGLTAGARVEVMERDGEAGSGPRRARYTVDVTAKQIGPVALVDERAIDAATGKLVVRVALRSMAVAIPDSAEAAARRLAAKIATSHPKP